MNHVVSGWLSVGFDFFCVQVLVNCEGTVASGLVCSFLDQVVLVRALARDTVLCSWARHLTLTVPLSTQEYKWVLANCWENLTNCGEVTCDGLASRPGGVEILLAASCYRNLDKLRHWMVPCRAMPTLWIYQIKCQISIEQKEKLKFIVTS